MELVLFLVTAAIALVGAVAMLVSRNAVHSALFLLLNFGAIAVLFLLLRAPFLFAIQVSVYAGAIMVLFLFVVMLLGAERAEDGRDELFWQTPLALLLGVVLLVEAVMIAVRGGGRETGADTAPVPITGAETFGAPEEIGRVLFTRYLLPFEVAGIILLVAIVGVVVLSRRAMAAEEA
ncbi:MAG: NADH-quinone oxidoreductase subunit J [Chloroflexaceae bacterium]|nr:NADH-quinone oxidoreductase subunit J [Chloroflexaceae bacterium]